MTYSGALMKKLWKQYIAGLGRETVFLHKDEFTVIYPRYIAGFPVILLVYGDTMTTLITPDDFTKLNNLTDLMNLMNERLVHAGQ